MLMEYKLNLQKNLISVPVYNVQFPRLRPSAVVYNLHACLHKSIPNVPHSLSAKRVLTRKDVLLYTPNFQIQNSL